MSVGTQGVGPSFAGCFPRLLTVSYISGGAARIQTGAYMGCQQWSPQRIDLKLPSHIDSGVSGGSSAFAPYPWIVAGQSNRIWPSNLGASLLK